MKVHQFARGLWDYEPSSSLTLGCKRLRPLAPKLDSPSFDLKTFVRPEGSPRKLPAGYSGEYRDSSSPPHHVPSQPHQQVDAQQGGTRWNPTEEQVSILEMLYRKGLRTPKTQQIEQITAELGKYGKIEGKNVFYWFQNHKARERQKQKRNSLGLAHTPRTPPPAATSTAVNLDISRSVVVDIEREGDSGLRRVMCRSWALEMSSMDADDMSSSSMEGGDRTLELFPLHPESR